MFFKKKKSSELDDIFEKANEYVEYSKENNIILKGEQGLVFSALLLDWFYAGNRLFIAKKHLELLPDNPRSRHTVDVKEKLKASEQELSKLFNEKSQELNEMRGDNYTDYATKEFEKMFINK